MDVSSATFTCYSGLINSSVYTKYGPGVLLKYQSDSDKRVVCVWRPRAQGSSTACMLRDDIGRIT